MNLKEQYKIETGFSAFTTNNNNFEHITDSYVEWLEDQLKKLILDCEKCKWNTDNKSTYGVGNNYPCVTCMTNNFEPKED